MTHPAYMAGAIVSGADDRTRLELFGFYVSLMSMYAAHPTERVVVEAALVYAAGGPHTDRLVAQAVEAGYMTPTEVEGRQAWELINQAPFVHVRTKPEIDRDNARKRDNGNVALTLAVQRRDGSQCRYCGVPVNWGDNVGARGATYDHLDPARLKAGLPAKSAAEMVVACRSCNSSRGAAFKRGQLATWDAEHPLRPAPATPHYCEKVKARLAEAGMPLPTPTAERPATPTDPAPTPERPGTQPGTAGAGERPVAADTAAPHPPKGTEVNSPGREGPGRAGSGRAGSGAARRRRRGRRRGGGDPPNALGVR